ncbi:RAI1 like PD-XK nuclease-domain-containing protein [Scheffersomyces coipomensis]|uniref:RAI1 like PD-XK nuclease-domain-containing protein n=1 Tax=Scheffersomyces coipomensis TaxID=1788519 RepID=UPI00315C7278
MSKTFPLSSRSPTTSLKQPKELFCFIRDIDGEYMYDEDRINEENLNYYYLPDSSLNGTRIDLSAGFSKFKKIDYDDNLPNFKTYLQAIKNYEIKNGNSKLKANIITFRGIMTRLLTLPYNSQDSLDLNIVKYDGQIFINLDHEIEIKKHEQETKERAALPIDKQDYLNKCEFSGYKFETISTLPKHWSDCSRQLIERRNKKIVNNFEQYLSVIRTGIGNIKMILVGEVDGLWDYKPLVHQDGSPLDHYIELKTSKVIENNGQIVNFEKKLFKTWGQCFLMGVKKIIYGLRDDKFVLRTVEIYDTNEVPLLIKNNPLTNGNNGGNESNKINCTSALKWYGAVLEWINEQVIDEDTAYRLSYNSQLKTMILKELPEEDNQRLRNGEILNEDFINWRESLK